MLESQGSGTCPHGDLPHGCEVCESMISDAAKEYWSRNHNQSPRLLPEGEGQDHRYTMARLILAYNPNSVFEFGCSSGRNLAAIRSLITNPNLELHGVDINEIALTAGRNAHPSLLLEKGDELFLKNPALALKYDIVFTVSVFDHIPHWEPVYNDLKGIASRAMLLLEPILEEGNHVYEGDLLGKVEAAPFTYSWDYEKFDPDLVRVQDLPITNIPGTLGPLYKVFAYERV